MSALTPIAADRFAMDRFAIAVSKPDHLPDDAADIPVLYVLDGDGAFSLVAEVARAMRLGLPPCFVVGIGYDADFADVMTLRTRDLTPPLDAEAKAALGAMTGFIGEHNGEADLFLSFILDTLVPEIARRYPQASTDTRFLIGHSLGGLFVAHVLLTRPDAFTAFIASSPSLWWNGFAVLSHLQDFPARLARLKVQPRALVSVGGLEQDIPAEVPPGVPLDLSAFQAFVAHSRMVDAAREFAEALRAAGLAQVRHVAFADEDHLSVGPAAISRGLHLALKPAP